MKTRDKEITTMYADGKSVAQIAEVVGMTTVGVRYVLNKLDLYEKKTTRVRKEILSEFHKKLGVRLAALRMFRNNWTEGQAARKFNLSVQSINQFEKGYRDITLLKLLEMCETYGITVSELTNMDEDIIAKIVGGQENV